MKILLAILIALGLSIAPTVLADTDVSAYSDFTYGTPSPVVDQVNNPNGYFDFVMGQPAVVYEFVEAEAPAEPDENNPKFQIKGGQINIKGGQENFK